MIDFISAVMRTQMAQRRDDAVDEDLDEISDWEVDEVVNDKVLLISSAANVRRREM